MRTLNHPTHRHDSVQGEHFLLALAGCYDHHEIFGRVLSLYPKIDIIGLSKKLDHLPFFSSACLRVGMAVFVHGATAVANRSVRGTCIKRARNLMATFVTSNDLNDDPEKQEELMHNLFAPIKTAVQAVKPCDPAYANEYLGNLVASCAGGALFALDDRERRDAKLKKRANRLRNALSAGLSATPIVGGVKEFGTLVAGEVIEYTFNHKKNVNAVYELIGKLEDDIASFVTADALPLLVDRIYLFMGTGMHHCGYAS